MRCTITLQAFSYVRISSKEQIKGTSKQRQLEDSEALALKMGWNLDTSIEDLGVSAYEGKNVSKGALGKFIKLCEEGKIAAGSVLIVESLDRLSRQQVLPALDLFTRLLNLGIGIYTLSDNQHYTQKIVNENPLSMIVSISTMVRANDESQMKSNRGKAAWKIKRANLVTKKLTSRCPYWMEITKDKKDFIVIEERAKVIVRIFEMMADGMGAYKICKTLNNEGVPNFTRTTKGGPETLKGWGQYYIHNLANSKQVIGIFEPKTGKAGGKSEATGDVIKDYFPRIVDDELYYRAVASRKSRRMSGGGRTGKQYSNLFAKIVKCEMCGGAMRHRGEITRSIAKTVYHVLQCKGYVKGTCKNAKRFKYEKLEDIILDTIPDIDVARILLDTEQNELSDLNEKLIAYQEKINQLNQSKKNLLRKFANSNDDLVLEIVDEMTVEITTLTESSKELVERQNILVATMKDISVNIDAIAEYRLQLGKLEGKEKYALRAALSSEIKKVIVNIYFDQHGGLFVETVRDGRGYGITDFIEGVDTLHDMNMEAQEHQKWEQRNNN